MTLVIPDAIEPYLGYKVLHMTKEGNLCSPSQHALWPPREPLVAECRNSSSRQPSFGWELVDCPEGWEDMFWVPSRFLTEGAVTTVGWPPSEPPSGKTWIPVKQAHKLQGCRCGIYVVSQARHCMGYMEDMQHVICEIALWGQVVRGDQGARGEFAYPQRIFAAMQQAERALMISDRYGIPLELVSFLDELGDES